jgi:hypothetical protein
MITYELYCRIKDGHARQGLTVALVRPGGSRAGRLG